MSHEYLFTPPPVVSLPVAGSQKRFPVRRIYCVARNYAAHAQEMGAKSTPEAPFFFGKPRDALVPGGGAVAYPPETTDLHHEVELVVALGHAARGVHAAEALSCIYGYAVGLDLTRRDLQRKAKDRAGPWDAAKGFDASAPASQVHPTREIGHPARGAITLHVNGSLRQSGDLADQIWSVPSLIAQLSRLVTLLPGDLIFSGTPAGVGPVNVGDVLHARVEGVDDLEVRITAPGDDS